MAEANGKALQATTKDPQKVVAYEAADGQRIELTAEIVKKYLVSGKPELITIQELVYFLNICKARRLNPLVKDCYLVKYDQSPAAIITSIDFYRKQARAQQDNKGWQKGLILWDEKEKQQLRTNGIMVPGYQLIGAWFKAKPAGWEVDFDLEVNLSGYIKKTRDGNPTQFWSKENQPSQIMKVAEAQGLRTVWPGLFQNIYEESEMPDPGQISSGVIDVGASADLNSAEILEQTWIAALPQGQDLTRLPDFLHITASKNKITVPELKRKLLADKKVADIVGRVFPAWCKMGNRAFSPEPPPPSPDEPEMAPGDCPNAPGTIYTKEFCDGQVCRLGCPTWPEAKKA